MTNNRPYSSKRREEKMAHTISCIRTSARNLFTSVGFEATTLRAVARSAGVSTGAIFAHWTDKSHLYRDTMGFEPPNVGDFARSLRELPEPGADPAQDAETIRMIRARADALVVQLEGHDR